jgi:hypothetical protein
MAATAFNDTLTKIMGELQFQFNESGGWTPENCPTPSVELLAMAHNLHRARANYVNFPGEEGKKRVLDAIRIVTAMGFRCLKNHGCPPRKGLSSPRAEKSHGKEKDTS